MNCTYCKLLIASLLDTKLGEAEVIRVKNLTQSHLLRCTSCRAWFMRDFKTAVAQKRKEHRERGYVN